MPTERMPTDSPPEVIASRRAREASKALRVEVAQARRRLGAVIADLTAIRAEIRKIRTQVRSLANDPQAHEAPESGN